jgi:hypothetical protein
MPGVATRENISRKDAKASFNLIIWLFLDSRFQDHVAISKFSDMPFCHSGLDPESSAFSKLCFWMPDQVRHDKRRWLAFLNDDTVFCVGLTASDSIQGNYLL